MAEDGSNGSVQIGGHPRMHQQHEQQSHLQQYDPNFQLPYTPPVVSDQYGQVCSREDSSYYSSQQLFPYQTYVSGSYIGNGTAGYHDPAETGRGTAVGSAHSIPGHGYHPTAGSCTSLQQFNEMTFGHARRHHYPTTHGPMNYPSRPYGEDHSSILYTLRGFGH